MIEKLIKRFNDINVHVETIPEDLEPDFLDKVVEIDYIKENIDAEIDDLGFIDITVSYWDSEIDEGTVTKICLYDREFEAWCKDLGIKIVELEVIKNDYKVSTDRFDRKRTNPTRSNLKLVA
jgi:hypothetical protein